MKGLFKITGTLGRSEYFKSLALLYLLTLSLGVAYLALTSFLGSWSETNLPALYIIILLTFALVIYFALAVYLSLVLLTKRTRQLNHPFIWTMLGVLVPFGYIIVGLIPAKNH